MRIAPTTVDFYHGNTGEIADRIMYKLAVGAGSDVENNNRGKTEKWINQHVCA